MSVPQKLGSSSEQKVCHLLKWTYKRNVKKMGYYAPFDALVDGWRVEIKCSSARIQRGVPIWFFNLHRHGKLVEEYDFYILRLEQVPFHKNAIHILLRAPIGRMTYSVSFRSLLNGEAENIINFSKFSHGEYGIGPNLFSSGYTNRSRKVAA